jgi:RNA polymerase sigma-70 factor, ECF subfamily
MSPVLGWNLWTSWRVLRDRASGGGVLQGEGFDAFYAASRQRLLRQLTAITADREQGLDVLQDAYVRAWQHWDRVSRLDDPEAWVRKVAWRLAMSRWRHVAVTLRWQSRLSLPREASTDDLDDALDVRAALARLPAGQRLVLVLHELCDLSVAQVASETGLSQGTVKSRLMRGRAALAAMLATGEEFA